MNESPRMDRILLIDDCPILLQACTALLWTANRDTVVDTAANAEAGLFFIASRHYDVIVTDLRMPGLDGLGLIKECRRLQPDTSVILMTGYGDADIDHQAMDIGAYACLHKPVDPEVFLSVIHRAALHAPIHRPTDEQSRESDRPEHDLTKGHANKILHRIREMNTRLQHTLQTSKESNPK